MKTAGKYEEDFKEDIKGAIEDRIDGEAKLKMKKQKMHYNG